MPFKLRALVTKVYQEIFSGFFFNRIGLAVVNNVPFKNQGTHVPGKYQVVRDHWTGPRKEKKRGGGGIAMHVQCNPVCLLGTDTDARNNNITFTINTSNFHGGANVVRNQNPR